MERKAFTVLSLREQPQLLKVAAQWFHSKWQIPCQAYEDSMQECITGTAFIPQWYVILDSSGTIIAGAGLIANDFHERKELTPNVCALYVEAGQRICKDAARSHSQGGRQRRAFTALSHH